ncbi:hypothetical protein [Streptomyces iconiensis]|uniref:Lipoprotein n=1 Tax=Streptomyces iconiensis TaxID=1384038 RepID=A0ABT6ZU85_9ACTN|nr:hypothetical protein [Streptomyces iconiensis]MDJ1132622.1 hypothetical protein [Streptomyces iconiensis]
MSLTPPQAAAGPRRRSVLAGALGAVGTAGAGAGLLTGCSGEGTSAATVDAERSDEARRLRARTARESETLLARYDGTLAVHPALAERLRPLREEVARHMRVLRDVSGAATASPSPSGSSASPGASPAPSRSGTTGAPPNGQPGPSAPEPRHSPDRAAVPHDEREALSALAGAERRLADARTGALADAPPELARLLASVAASGGAHVYLLEQSGAGR